MELKAYFRPLIKWWWLLLAAGLVAAISSWCCHEQATSGVSIEGITRCW